VHDIVGLGATRSELQAHSQTKVSGRGRGLKHSSNIADSALARAVVQNS